MPFEIFRILELDGGLADMSARWWDGLLAGISESRELSGILAFISDALSSYPIPIAAALATLAAAVLLFPVGLAKPLSALYSSALGFVAVLLYFPKSAAPDVPILLLAGIASLVALLLHRLISLLSYFSLVGCLAYISAYSGAFLGFGEGDIFLSLLISAALILASLLLLSPLRILGVAIIGGYIFALAISILIDFSLVFGGARDIVMLGIALFLALIAVRRYIRSRNKTDAKGDGHASAFEQGSD